MNDHALKFSFPRGLVLILVVLVLAVFAIPWSEIIPMSADDLWAEKEAAESSYIETSTVSSSSPLPPEWRFDDDEWAHVISKHLKGAGKNGSEFKTDKAHKIWEWAQEAVSVGGRSRLMGDGKSYELYVNMLKTIGQTNGKDTQWVRIVYEVTKEGIKRIKTFHPSAACPF